MLFVSIYFASLSVDEILIPRYVKWFNFRGLLFNVDMAPSYLKHVNAVLFDFTLRLMFLIACSRLCRRDSLWTGVFARSAISST